MMAGKVLKVVSNDLTGNVDDRKVIVYACFSHLKYMNNYVVFSFENSQDKLYYGSIHLKKDSLVIFNVKSNIKKYIDEFLEEFISDKIREYELLNLSNIQKVELVSYNEMEYDKIQILNEKTVTKTEVKSEKIEEKKPVFIYILLFILIFIGIGVTVLYFKPELFTIKYRVLECSNNLYDNEVGLNYNINKNIQFDRKNKVEQITVVRTYAFLDSVSYEKFKNDNGHNKYFNNGEGYKYFDNELKFKLFYEEDSVIDDYDEMFTYLSREGYNCVVTEYEK